MARCRGEVTPLPIQRDKCHRISFYSGLTVLLAGPTCAQGIGEGTRFAVRILLNPHRLNQRRRAEGDTVCQIAGYFREDCRGRRVKIPIRRAHVFNAGDIPLRNSRMIRTAGLQLKDCLQRKAQFFRHVGYRNVRNLQHSPERKEQRNAILCFYCINGNL